MSGPSPSAQDLLPGVHGCSKNCDCCLYMKKNINDFQSGITGMTYRISQHLNCKTSSVIYIIECKRCHIQFVEKTVSILKKRFSKLKNLIIKKKFRPISHHFNGNGHSLNDLMIFPIEQVYDIKKLKERELYWIEKLEIPNYYESCMLLFQGRPRVLNRDADERTMQHPSLISSAEPEQGTSSHSQNVSAAGTHKRKWPQNDPKIPNKKRKKEKKRCVFSRDTEQHLSACEDAMSDAREVISVISKKLEDVCCETRKSKEFLENLKQKTMDLEAQNPFEKIYIGLFGRTGAGKSSLINAIVQEDIVPTGSGQACTSVCVQVEANTENNKYRAEIEFISKEDWESEICYLLELLKKGEDDDSGDDESEFQELAEEKIRALYGEDGLHKTYDQMVGSKKVADIVDKRKKILSFAKAEELYKNISCYIRSDSDTEQAFWPLVKCVTIYVPDCPALPEGVVLVDLPGAGDANRQRDEMWKESINKCASVWIINNIDRALSDKEGHRIFKSSLKTIGGGGECHNITFICTKTDDINVSETKRNYKITDQDLEISEQMDSPDYNKIEREACILYRNEKIKEAFTKRFKAQVENMLLGEPDDSNTYFSVFTVSSQQYKMIQKNGPVVLKNEDTELPLLMEHMKKLYVSHFEKKVKDYLTQVSGVISFFYISRTPCNVKLYYFCTDEFNRLEKKLKQFCQEINIFLSEVEEKLQTTLDDGAREAERRCSVNAKKILQPVEKNYRGYHKTLKAMCRNNGYYRSSNGDVIDLNYNLSQPMYAKINENNMFVKTFSHKNLRNSVRGQLESFQDDLIKTSSLEVYKKTSEKYMRLLYIKTQQRKLLSNVEQEILQRKKRIYDSVSLSVQETLQPVYTELGTAEKYTLAYIQENMSNNIASLKHIMFKKAKTETLTLFHDLRTWIVKEIETQMIMAMRVALKQTPDDFFNLPDVDEEFKAIKRSCESLHLNIFV